MVPRIIWSIPRIVLSASVGAKARRIEGRPEAQTEGKHENALRLDQSPPQGVHVKTRLLRSDLRSAKEP